MLWTTYCTVWWRMTTLKTTTQITDNSHYATLCSNAWQHPSSTQLIRIAFLSPKAWNYHSVRQLDSSKSNWPFDLQTQQGKKTFAHTAFYFLDLFLCYQRQRTETCALSAHHFQIKTRMRLSSSAPRLAAVQSNDVWSRTNKFNPTPPEFIRLASNPTPLRYVDQSGSEILPCFGWWSAWFTEGSAFAFTLLMLSIPICCDKRRELRWGL